MIAAVPCSTVQASCETCAQAADSMEDFGQDCLLPSDLCEVGERTCRHHCDCWWGGDGATVDGCCWCERKFVLSPLFGGGS